jgi:hypothetical protein
MENNAARDGSDAKQSLGYAINANPFSHAIKQPNH